MCQKNKNWNIKMNMEAIKMRNKQKTVENSAGLKNSKDAPVSNSNTDNEYVVSLNFEM